MMDSSAMERELALGAEIAALRQSLASSEAANARMRELIVEACDLLSERRYGNSARSPGHNARLCLEAALSPPVEGGLAAGDPARSGGDHGGIEGSAT